MVSILSLLSKAVTFSFICFYLADIDECSLYRSCPQKCTNFYGGYNCSCEDNFYELRIDGATVCHAKGKHTFILIIKKHNLHKIC